MLTIIKAIKFAFDEPKEVLRFFQNAVKTIPILSISPIQSHIKGIWRYLPDKYVLESLQKRIPDTNDYLENPHHQAENATRELFSILPEDLFDQKDNMPINVLEVGAGTGRFTREIVKYLPKTARLMCLEYYRPSYEYLKQYVIYKNLKSVNIEKGDFYNNGFKEGSFKLILIPWFTLTMNLYRWAKLFNEVNRLLEKDGYLVVDFMDSQDDLIQSISLPQAAPYYLVNGADIEIIADYYGFKKVNEFSIEFNQLIDKYHIYMKNNQR